MIVAKTRCRECGKVIALNSKYGWTSLDENRQDVWCMSCSEYTFGCCDKYEESDEFED